MSEFRIQSWKYGLDSRRSELTSQPGTLATLENAHVNQGAEIEKRKAFARYFDATKLDPTKVFGLQPTSNGFVVFGSVTAASLGLTAWPSYSSPVTNCPPVSYMQLTHPDGSTAMSSVLSSDSYSDIPFVVAKFSDDNVYVYYNGSIATDFIAGLVSDAMKTTGVVDNAKIARHLELLVNQTSGYTAAQNAQFGSASDITGESQLNFTIFPTIDVASDGDLLALPNSAGTPSYKGQGATGSFIIYAATDTAGQITSIKYGTTELLLAHVSANSDGDVSQLAQAVCQMINASADSGFTAFASGNLVTITAPTSDAATLTVTTVKVCIGDYNATLTGSLNITALSINSVNILTGAQYASPQLTATVSSITWAANVMTINTTAAHNLAVGALISVVDTNSTYNTGGSNPSSWTCVSGTTGTVIKITRTGSGSTYTGAGTVTLLTSYNTIAALRTAIVDDINNGSSGYAAVDTLPITYISKKISASTDSNLSVAWTYTGTGSISASGGNSLNASVASNLEAVQWYNVGGGFGNQWQLSTGTITCKVIGGSPPYSYSWQLLSSSGAYTNKPGFSSSSSASTHLVVLSFSGGSAPPLKSGTWTIQCNVKDSTNATTSSPVITCTTGV